MSERPNYGASISEFFETKGALELAFHIGHGGESFTSLEEITGLSPATLSKRLKEGEQLGIWMTIAKRPGGGRSKQKYVPTKNGLKIVAILEEANFSRAYTQYLNHKETLENVRQQVLDLIKKNDAEFSRAQEYSLNAITEQQSDGELELPWKEQPEPTAEARESISDLDISAKNNPFDHHPTDNQSDSEDRAKKEQQFQRLLDDLIDSYPDDISPEELVQELHGKNNDEND